MRAVLALLGLVGLVVTGLFLARGMVSHEPVMPARKSHQPGVERPSKRNPHFSAPDGGGQARVQSPEPAIQSPPANGPVAEQPKSQFRLPYAKATQPVAEDRATPEVKSEPVRYRRVIPESAGVVKTATTKIYLAGVDALAHDAQCKLPSGKTWPCGRIGTVSLRRLIRSRSILCTIVKHLDDGSVLAQCAVAKIDINRWVVRNGWGHPAEASSQEFTEAFEAAQREKKGQWRETSRLKN